MNEISVIMPVYNTEKYVAEAIESVLQQSFEDFELIIVDDGSTDGTCEVINSFADHRIRLVRHTHNYIGALNKALAMASGKYVARMDADDVMNIDRLKIQHAIMEEVPEITVCGSWMLPIVEGQARADLLSSFVGFVNRPLLALLKNNILFHPTTFIRRSFLADHGLTYESYPWAEDYKLWFEIARRGGVFYVESLPLLFYRFSNQQVTHCRKEEQQDTVWMIKQEIVKELFERYRINDSAVLQFYDRLLDLVNKRILAKEYAAQIMYDLCQNLL